MIIGRRIHMRRLGIALVLTLTALGASAGTIEQSFDQTYDVRSGANFALVNTNGSITIRSWDQPRVRIHADKRVRGSGDEAKKVMAALKIEITPSAAGLSVVTRYPKRGDDGSGFLDWLFGSHVDASVTYEVTVPRSMSLDLENTNGAIAVTDVRGSHKVSTTNGRIELARCAGDVSAETTNGGIKAELLAVTPGKRVSLETTNGRISLAAPPT